VLLWGLLLAVWLARAGLLESPERYPVNHESYSYVGRLIEFRDQLRAGYLWPEWCTNFRAGLGSPHNLYYQPGLFYAASLVPWWVPPVRALAITVAGFALLGYLAMYGLVAERFGRLAGWVAASALLLASYTGTEVCVRGDLSEYAAMMVLPALLYGLAGWLEHGRRRDAVVLTAAAGAIIVLHAAIGLLGYGLAALALAGFAWETRLWNRLLGALGALGVAAGLAGFYWLPMSLGWNLVNSQEALEGWNHYTMNWVRPLTRLVGLYRQRPFTSALTLDVLLPPLLLVCLVSTIRRWRALTAPQRRLAVFCLAGTVCFTLLMTKESKPLWYLLPLLQRMQFPWRAMTVVTVLVAAASGSMPLWQANRHRRIFAGLIVLELWLLSWQYTTYQLDQRRVPQNAVELAQECFAPDVCHEWLPRGAEKDVPRELCAGPTAGPHCQATQFVRSQGQLRCLVRCSATSFVTLPHYYFPIGWQATLDGRPAALRAGRYGLMRVELPGPVQGQLVVTFHLTWLRRLGLAVSAASLLVGAVALLLVRKSGLSSELAGDLSGPHSTSPGLCSSHARPSAAAGSAPGSFARPCLAPVARPSAGSVGESAPTAVSVSR
jgi:hypothetical protein